MVNGFYFPTYGPWYDLMQTWSQYGVFTVLLPLILVFAVVFAILERIKLFRNSGVHMLIALVIGFFTISNPTVSGFFMYLFGNLAWGIAILVAVVILVGLAIKPEENTWRRLFIWIGAILLLAILAKPTPWGQSGFRFIFGDAFWNWIQNNMPMVIIFVLLIGAVFAVVAAGRKEAEKEIKIPAGR